MKATAIRLSAVLSARVERLAAAVGGTAHAFMLEAIAEVTDQRERCEAFHAEADKVLKKIARTGGTSPTRTNVATR